RSLHFQLFGQSVHLGDENVRGSKLAVVRSWCDRSELRSNAIGQGIGSDVIGFNEGSIKKVAQRSLITRLKTDIVFSHSGKRLRRNRNNLIEIAALMLGPVEHDRGGRDFGQAADLPFL